MRICALPTQARLLAPLLIVLAGSAACSRPLTQPQAPAPSTAPTSGTQAAAPTAANPGTAKAVSASGEPKRATAGVALAEATTVYNQRCALCHGAHGRGDGVAAANLRPAPRSFADAAWQEGTSDAAIREIIVRGGKAVGRSMMMPPAKDLADQDELLAGLVAIVRNFGPGGARAPTP